MTLNQPHSSLQYFELHVWITYSDPDGQILFSRPRSSAWLTEINQNCRVWPCVM